MIDTICIISPCIDEKIAQKIEDHSMIRLGLDMETKEQLYKFTSKQLAGSYDSQIRISVMREKWITIFNPDKDKYIAEKIACKPYLEIELSLHKFYLGHNVWGGSDNLILQLIGVLTFISEEFNIKLPTYEKYTVKRLDYARVYKIPSTELFFKGFSNIYYPRRQRKKEQHGYNSIYFPSRYTTLKLYDKFEEFKVHDMKRCNAILGIKETDHIINVAKNLLRVEVEIKSQKLKHLYNDKLPKVTEINMQDIKNHFDEELRRVFKYKEEGEKDMKQQIKYYNNSKDVTNRLYSFYTRRLANTLLGTWYRLSTDGYETVKSQMNDTTFYRHIKQLKECNISWNHTDVLLDNSNVVEFVFNPLNSTCEIVEDLIDLAM